MLEKPKLFGNLVTQVIRPNLCSFCEICYYQCPNVELSRDDVETFLFNRTRRPDEPIGITNAILVGRATKPEIQSQAQDGGVVTALLAYALESKMIDAAVVAGRDSKWIAKPSVATSTKGYLKVVKMAETKRLRKAIKPPETA
jgi:coenzyme F420-reducing hydrogenase beta subunit